MKSFAATLSLLAMSSAAAAPAGAVYANSASFSSSVVEFQQVAQVRGSERNERDSRSKSSSAPVQPSASAEDALRSIRFITRAKFIVMPVFDKSGSSMQYGSSGGSMTTTNEFATEVLNDSIHDLDAMKTTILSHHLYLMNFVAIYLSIRFSFYYLNNFLQNQ